MAIAITITPVKPDWFDVQLEARDMTTSHRVHAPEQLLEGLGLTDIDPELVVRETFAFLLEREPPSSILDEFSLDVVSGYFPEFHDELRRRLGR
jgi:hypothetical protein